MQNPSANFIHVHMHTTAVHVHTVLGGGGGGERWEVVGVVKGGLGCVGCDCADQSKEWWHTQTPKKVKFQKIAAF